MVAVCGLWLVVSGQPATAQTNEIEESPTTAVAELPGVDELMGNLLARLPAKPITLTGELATTAENDQKSKLNIIIQLRYPQEATYTLCDTFGKSLEQLTVKRVKGITSYRYLKGEPLSPAPVPTQDTRIQNTALCWMDLTLGFLWWNGGKIIGRGVPGLFWSKDLVLQDDSGFITLIYRQPLDILQTLFGIFKAEHLVGKDGTFKGWYRRGPIPYVELSSAQFDDGDRAGCYYASYLWVCATLVTVAGALVFFARV